MGRWPEHEAIRKRYIEERYRLLPYIYTSMEQTSRTGVPLMRSLFLDFPDDPRMVSADADSEFMFGDDLLVAPTVKEYMGGYEAILPKGVWYDYWTGQRVEAAETIDLTPTTEISLTADRKKLHLNPALDQLPVFARAGAIVPRQPVVQNTDQMPQGPWNCGFIPGRTAQAPSTRTMATASPTSKGSFIVASSLAKPRLIRCGSRLERRKGSTSRGGSRIQLSPLVR